MRRHPDTPRVRWTPTVSVKEEIEHAQELLHEVEKATPRGCQTLMTWGNHCYRLSQKIVEHLPELNGLPGTDLQDFFPNWRFTMSICINDDLHIKHRYRGGVTAGRMNALHAGRSIITNHTHQLSVHALGSYAGVRYGCEAGTLNSVDGPHALYAEDNPNSQRSGFLLCMFVDGVLLQPEPIAVHSEGLVDFRGQLIRV